MISTSIIYSNLRAEMARRNINIQTIADTLGIRRETASRKLSGKQSIGLDEAFKIKETFFPEVDIWVVSRIFRKLVCRLLGE